MTAVEEAVAKTPEELAVCCAELAELTCFGFDTEFVGESSYHPELCLIQVSTPTKLWLIDPLSAGPLDAFWQLIVDPSRVVIVHAGREEARLCHLWSGRPPANLFDLQIAAGMIGLSYPLGHGPLVQQMLNVRVEKGQTLTEWRVRPLTPEQVRYAFDDVRYLIPLYQRIHQRLQDLRRIEWAREEFARLTQASTAEPRELEKYRKLRGVGSLDRRRLAIVRELHLWRERKAAQINAPPRVVVRDDLLIEIAKRGPKRERDLKVVRGLAHRHVDEILDVVQQARALPLEECPAAIPRDHDSPQLTMITQLLCAVLADWSARNEIASGLVASNRDVKLLVRARRHGKEPSSKCILTQGWRREHVLPVLTDVLDGKRRLRIHDVRSELPFVIEADDAEPASSD